HHERAPRHEPRSALMALRSKLNDNTSTLNLVSGVTNVNAGHVLWYLKAHLLELGCTIKRSGNGRTDGAASHDPSGGAAVALNATRANGIGSQTAWFEIETPIGVYLLFQVAGSTLRSHNIKRSFIGFTGGSPASNVLPTAVDEHSVATS